MAESYSYSMLPIATLAQHHTILHSVGQTRSENWRSQVATGGTTFFIAHTHPHSPLRAHFQIPQPHRAGTIKWRLFAGVYYIYFAAVLQIRGCALVGHRVSALLKFLEPETELDWRSYTLGDQQDN